jgi:DNA (cytosine-5)-methyltransferase 1
VRFGSVCSGIEAASMAWNPLGWRAAFVSEIDKFPCAVLSERHAETPNYGDILGFKEWPDAAIDILVGGTPCQSFSAAGLRKGLDDPRGNLMLTYLAIAARYRPQWLVWENVPGVLSSGKGRDFGSLLGGLAELGYGFAYRVLDAQYMHLAQRRERVFVVGCLGDWRRAAAVLFERACLRGDLAPSRETGEKPAASLTSGSHPGSNAPGRRREDDVNLVAGAMSACGGTERKHGHGWGQQDYENGYVVADTVRSHPRPGSNSLGNVAFTASGFAGYSEGVGTLRAHGGDLGGGRRDHSSASTDARRSLQCDR